MVCDGCGLRETLKDKPLQEERAENDAVRARMARWHPLSTRNMGGETQWDLCPVCFASFIEQFTKGTR